MIDSRDFSRSIERATRGVALALLATFIQALGPAGVEAVQLSPAQTLQTGIPFVTSVALGPEDPDPGSLADGCLYATSGQLGNLHRVCFDASKSVTSHTVVVTLNGGVTQFLMGVAFDPASDPAGDIILYLSWEPLIALPFETKIARAVSTDGGATYSVDESFISGLGKSTVHTTNGMAFGPDGCLYLAKGNNSNAGFDPGFAESRLSGAILRACFRNPDGSVDPGFDRNCGSGSVQQACDVEVYASGFRNPYDLAWHSNGKLYATDNDMDPEDNQGCGSVANTFGCTCVEPSIDPMADELNLVEAGGYYGSPNPYLANPASLQCQGGNQAGFACTTSANCGGGGSCEDLSALCTDAVCDEDVQCLYFGSGVSPGPGDDPNALYREPIAQPAGARLNGIWEFGNVGVVEPGAFCSDWNGQLLTGGSTTNFFLPRRFELATGGLGAVDLGTAGLAGLSGLDLTVGPDGAVYSADWQNQRVQYATPVLQTNANLADFFAFCSLPGGCSQDCKHLATVPALPRWALPVVVGLLLLATVQLEAMRRLRRRATLESLSSTRAP